MVDSLYRGIIEELDVRFSYALTTDLANAAVLAHNCDPVSAHLLSRGLTASILASPQLTDDERLTINWRYSGALGSILIDVGANGDIRGFINPTNLSDIANSEDDIFGATCTLKVDKSNNNGMLNSGQIQSIFCDPVMDLTHYYCVSEQVESAMTVMVGFDPDPDAPVALAQGFFIQALPGCDLEVFDKLRTNLERGRPRDLLSNPPGHDNWFEAIIMAVSEGVTDAPREQIVECPTPEFRCNCSPEKMLGAVKTLPPDQRKDVLEKGEDLVVTCHFCNTKHALTVSDLRQAFEE